MASSTLIRRTKVFFPNWYLYVIRGGNQYEELGKVTFRTTPNIGKQDVTDYLKYIYGMVAKKVNVIAYEGKKKRLPDGKWFKEPTYKKFIVWFDKSAKAPKKDPSLELADEYQASLFDKPTTPTSTSTPSQ